MNTNEKVYLDGVKKTAYNATQGVAAYILRLAIICIIVTLAFNLMRWTFGWGIDSTDRNGWTRSDMTLYIDYGTGLEYLGTDGALIPRLDSTGKQIHFSK